MRNKVSTALVVQRSHFLRGLLIFLSNLRINTLVNRGPGLNCASTSLLLRTACQTVITYGCEAVNMSKTSPADLEKSQGRVV